MFYFFWGANCNNKTIIFMYVAVCPIFFWAAQRGKLRNGRLLIVASAIIYFRRRRASFFSDSFSV